MTSDPAAKGSAKDLEVAGASLVHCHFPFPPSSLPCVVLNVVIYYKHAAGILKVDSH